MEVNGITLGVERTGDGPAVLLLGGTGMPPIAWQMCGLVDALAAQRFQVVSYAARGVAPSAAPPGPYTIVQLAGDAAGILDALCLGEVTVVGYSLGSFTAEWLVRTRPDLVSRMVLLAGAGPMSPLLSAVVQIEADLIGEYGRIPAAAAKLQTLLTGLPPTMLRDDPGTVSQWLGMLDMQEHVWASVDGENGQSAASYGWLHDPDRMPALKDITVPVLVASFEHDLYFPPHICRQAAELLPAGEFAVIGGAAHAGLMTHPEQTTRVIVDWLTRR